MDQLPEWIDFEMEQPDFNVSPLVDALQQRRQRKPLGGLGRMAGGAMNDSPAYSDLLSGAIKSPPQKGVKSL